MTDSRTPEHHQHLRREAMALIDHLGLRDGEAGSAARRELVLDHLERLNPAARDHVEALLHEVGGAEHAIRPADRELLTEVRARASADQARLDALRGALTPEFERPVPFDGRPVSPEEAVRLADEATRIREFKSDQTLAQLRHEAATSGTYPTVRLQLGGGASLAGRDPDALLVDDRGRWQSDSGTRIAQTADQLRNLNRTGLGDPYQFAHPQERVSLEAVRYWEDTVAAHGPVINGAARLRLDPDGGLLADITPGNGSGAITVRVAGAPVVTTGFPPEAIVGVDRGLGVRGTFEAVSSALDGLGTPEALHAKAAVNALHWSDPASAATTMEIFGRHGIDPASLPARVVDSVHGLETWHEVREPGPDGLRRVLTGDEANLEPAKGRYDPDAAQRWVVAGTGGTAISAVENMLRLSDHASFTMVGREPPPGLGENTQWRQVRAAHDLGYDPGNPTAPSTRLADGSWPNPDASGRLTMVFGKRIDGVQVVSTPDGQTGYVVAGVGGDGVVVSLGGRSGVPPAVTDLVDAALKRDPGAVSGEMLFDNGGQYLGYRLAVGGHAIDVSGAASRFYPTDVFTYRPGGAPAHPASALDDGVLWSTEDHRYALSERPWRGGVPPPVDASWRDAPPESGNFDGGYVATAVQVTHYIAFVTQTDVRPMDGLGGPP
jgi:hypothetical protein